MTSTAAPAPTAEVVTIDVSALTVGQEIVFRGYAELQPDQAPIFQPGEAIRVVEVNGDIATVASLDGKKSDTAYGDEISLPEVAAAPAKAAKPPKAPKAPAAGKAPATPAVETPAPVAPAAPAAAAPVVKGGGAAAKKAEAAAKKAAAEKTKADAKAAKDAEKAAAAAKAKEAKPPKAPKVAVPVVKAEPEPVEIVNTQSVDDVLEGSDALTAARHLIDQTEETFFTLGGVLAHVYHGELYKTVGYDGKEGWANYLKEELNLEYRKSQYLIQIYQAFTALDIDEKRLSEIGWSKAKEITRAVTAENVEDLLAFASEHTKEEIIEHMKVTYPVARKSEGTGQVERTTRTAFKFVLFENEAAVVKQAIEAAKERGDTTDVNAAMYLMVSEWSQLSGAVEVSLEEAIANLNAKYGVEVAVQEAAAGE